LPAHAITDFIGAIIYRFVICPKTPQNFVHAVDFRNTGRAPSYTTYRINVTTHCYWLAIIYPQRLTGNNKIRRSGFPKLKTIPANMRLFPPSPKANIRPPTTVAAEAKAIGNRACEGVL
jgi:hypothetical protein